jgi:hypothetical protein
VDPNQLAASVLAVLVAASICSAFIFIRRGAQRRWGYGVLALCAMVAIASWTRFGSFHEVWVDSSPSAREPGDGSGTPKKVRRQQPFHFHEFLHYYIGSKYFRELGYVDLYDCTTLADREIAEEQHAFPRIGGTIRDLGDVLSDKPYAAAIAHCQGDALPHFSAKRWTSFKDDLRELERLVPDDWWNGVVFDAGFNPPPSWVLLGSAVANIIPIRIGEVPTYLVATSLDMGLLLASFLALQSAFGAATASVAVVYFGASFIASYGWNGGAFLRYTWLTTIVLSLCAMKRRRWVLAGALLGAATCDRLFPAGFAAGAMIPFVLGRAASSERRRVLLAFAGGFGGAVLALVIVSSLIFGVGPWLVFFARIFRHSDVYYVMHIGLKKVLTYRDWVPSKNFHGHDGLARFRDWNLRLRATWGDMRPLAIPIQAAAIFGTLWASIRRRPYEAAMLSGIVFMFAFNLPANYYYSVIALVPALLFRSAATAPSTPRRLRDFAALTAFSAFWMYTLIAPHLASDDIIYNFYISVSMGLFIVVWIVAWAESRADLAASLRRLPFIGQPRVARQA